MALRYASLTHQSKVANLALLQMGRFLSVESSISLRKEFKNAGPKSLIFSTSTPIKPSFGMLTIALAAMPFVWLIPIFVLYFISLEISLLLSDLMIL